MQLQASLSVLLLPLFAFASPQPAISQHYTTVQSFETSITSAVLPKRNARSDLDPLVAALTSVMGHPIPDIATMTALPTTLLGEQSTAAGSIFDALTSAFAQQPTTPLYETTTTTTTTIEAASQSWTTPTTTIVAPTPTHEPVLSTTDEQNIFFQSSMMADLAPSFWGIHNLTERYYPGQSLWTVLTSEKPDLETYEKIVAEAGPHVDRIIKLLRGRQIYLPAVVEWFAPMFDGTGETPGYWDESRKVGWLTKWTMDTLKQTGRVEHTSKRPGWKVVEEAKERRQERTGIEEIEDAVNPTEPPSEDE